MEAPPLPGYLAMHSRTGNIYHNQKFGAIYEFYFRDKNEYSGPDSFRNVEFKPYIKAEPEFTKFYGRPNNSDSHKINTPTPAFVPGVLKTLL